MLGLVFSIRWMFGEYLSEVFWLKDKIICAVICISNW